MDKKMKDTLILTAVLLVIQLVIWIVTAMICGDAFGGLLVTFLIDCMGLGCFGAAYEIVRWRWIG